MATDAQIDANRRNAAKSTGPKTEKGKAKARLNALKHGRRAKTTDVMPVLPHEDPRQLEERIQVWIDDWQPRNALESELVRRGARLSWMLERGERFEAAHLAHRVRLAGRQAGPTGLRPADEGRQRPGPQALLRLRARDALLALAPLGQRAGRLRRRARGDREGCRWLLGRWRDLRTLLERGEQWSPSDVYRFIRLLGKHGVEAVNDRELNALFLAWDVLWRGRRRSSGSCSGSRRRIATRPWSPRCPGARSLTGRPTRPRRVGRVRGDRRPDRAAGTDSWPSLKRSPRPRRPSAPTAPPSTPAPASSATAATSPPWAASCSAPSTPCAACGKRR